MVHADSGQLMAYLDGEIPVRDRDAIESHLSGCGPCEEGLAELRGMASEFSAAVAVLDAPAPMLRARAKLQPYLAPARHSAAGARRIPADLLKAAAIVLLLAGAASAAIPGSPVRRLVETIAERAAILIADQPESLIVQAPEPLRAAPPADDQRRQPGLDIRVAPEAGRARVSIHSPAAGATISVRLVDAESRVRITVLSDDDTRVQSGGGYADVFDNTAGMLILVPRNLASMTVEVDGRLYFVKDGSQTRLPGPGTRAGPGEFVFHAHSR